MRCSQFSFAVFGFLLQKLFDTCTLLYTDIEYHGPISFMKLQDYWQTGLAECFKLLYKRLKPNDFRLEISIFISLAACVYCIEWSLTPMHPSPSTHTTRFLTEMSKINTLVSDTWFYSSSQMLQLKFFKGNVAAWFLPLKIYCFGTC